MARQAYNTPSLYYKKNIQQSICWCFCSPNSDVGLLFLMDLMSRETFSFGSILLNRASRGKLVDSRCISSFCFCLRIYQKIGLTAFFWEVNSIPGRICLYFMNICLYIMSWEWGGVVINLLKTFIRSCVQMSIVRKNNIKHFDQNVKNK